MRVSLNSAQGSLISDRVSHRLVFLTNIPAPYRIAFQNRLHRKLSDSGRGLSLLYAAPRESNRNWQIDWASQEFEWGVLPGLSFETRRWHGHFNPTVLSRIRRLRPEWLMIGGAWNMPTVLLVCALRRFVQCPVIGWMESHLDSLTHRGGPVAWLRKAVLSRFDAFAVPNVRSQEYVTTQIRKNLPLLELRNTVDEEFWRAAPQVDKATLRKTLALPPDKLVVSVVAQLEDRKGILEAASALQWANQRKPQKPLALVFIGEGSLKQKLLSQYGNESGILVVGNQSPEQVRNFLRASDAFLLPTKSDPNPLSVLEAAFAGLPLLVSRLAGNAFDLVRDNENGFIIPAVNSAAIGTALLALAQCTPEQRAEMGRASNSIAEASFSRDAVAEKFLQQLVHFFPGKTASERLVP